MNIPRELIYEEKKSLEQFGINDEKSINHTIYDNWLITRTDLITKSNLGLVQLKVFNDAYFICTTALMHQHSIEAKNYFLKNVDIPSVVFPLALFFLSRVKNSQVDNSRLLKLIETQIQTDEGWKKNFQDINGLEIPKRKKIEASLFAPRKLTPELLSSLKWGGITDGFKIRAIKIIIYYFAKDLNEQKMFAVAIKEGAEEYEWNYNNEICAFQGIDEDGKYFYEEEKPIRLSKVYELCDRIDSSDVFLPMNEDKSQIENNSISLKINLQHFLSNSWFDEYSNDRQKYTVSWRENMINDLIASEHGKFIIQQWQVQKHAKQYMIKMALVGALIDVNVLKLKTTKMDLISNFGILEQKCKSETLSTYMKRDKNKPYLEWLRAYVNQ